MRENIIKKDINRSLYCFAESFIYTSMVYIFFFYMTPFKHHFLELNLHPLLIVVAVISIRYGTHLSSFVVGFSAFYYFLAYLKVERDPVLFFATFEYYKFILMFFFTALLVGKLRDTTDEKIMHMESELKSLKKTYVKQRRNNVKLGFTNNRLKRQIINSKESIITLHHITSLMDSMWVEEIYTKALQNIRQFIDCDVISIYSYNEEKNFSRLKLSVGNRRMSSFFQLEDGSAHKKVAEAREVMQFPLEITGDTPVYIAPIMNKERVVGFINVERLSFEAQERYSFEMFKIIAHWLNKALAEAIDKDETEKAENSYEGTRILEMSYFNRRLEEEIRRKKLFDMEFMAFEGDIGDIDPGTAYERIRGNIRAEDVVGMDKGIIRFLFPASESKNKELLLNKVDRIFEGVDFYEI